MINVGKCGKSGKKWYRSGQNMVNVGKSGKCGQVVKSGKCVVKIVKKSGKNIKCGQKVVNVVKSGKSRQKVVIEVKRMWSNSIWSKVVKSGRE